MALADIVTATDIVARSNGTVELTDDRLVPYLDDALAQAALYAPCLQADSLLAIKSSIAKGIICDAVLRRLHRDEQSQDTDVAAETWTAGPLGRTINFADNSGAGRPLYTRADQDMLSTLCKRKSPVSIPISLPTVNDPTQSGWPTGYRAG